MKYRNRVCPEDSQNTISGILLIKEVDKINSSRNRFQGIRHPAIPKRINRGAPNNVVHRKSFVSLRRRLAG